MHDATERGLFGALYEVASVSGNGISIDKEHIPLAPATRDICSLYGIDPYSSSSEGTLVITCVAAKSGDIIRRLSDKGVSAALIGELADSSHGRWVHSGSTKTELVYPGKDPFWGAFTRNNQSQNSGG
jgi:hydrogenase maturation factor